MRGFEWYYLSRLFRGDLVTITAHGGSVTGVAFMPDGQRLVSVGTTEPPRGGIISKDNNGEVKLWDAVTGQPVRFQFNGSNDAAESSALFSHIGEQSMALSRDGTLVAASGGDSTVRVLNLATGKLITLEGPAKHTATGLTFSHDGNRLISVYRSGGASTFDSPSLIKIWESGDSKGSFDSRSPTERPRGTIIQSKWETPGRRLPFTGDRQSVGRDDRRRSLLLQVRRKDSLSRNF